VKNYLVAWVSGFLVALVLTERWRRIGSPAVPTAVSPSEPSEASSPGIATRARTVTSTASRSVVAGAKADLARIRQLAGRVRPGHHVDVPDVAADQDESSDLESPQVPPEG
jgi:hypothetical protein